MLRNVLAVYLDAVKERDFDLPFISLLSTLGFFDIHKTHGTAEFGKDFIAKKDEDGQIFQYSFQVKAGNISQTDWNSGIQGQMLLSVLSGLNHPNFDKNLQHIPVLVTTGDLTPQAGLSVSDLNRQLEEDYKKPTIECWTKENILDFVMNSNFENFYLATSSRQRGYGKFFELYGKAVDGVSVEKDFEIHSRDWLEVVFHENDSLLVCTMETVIICKQAEKSGNLYESYRMYLSLHRFILYQIYNFSDDAEKLRFLKDVNEQLIKIICRKGIQIFNGYKDLWKASNKNLVSEINSSGIFITYLVHCCRILEIVGFLYFCSDVDKTELKSFLVDFISTEPGACHIPSDNYAISILLPCLALISEGEIELVKRYLTDVVVWLCDRYEGGIGIASFGSAELEEIEVLLGSAFDFIDAPASGSFLATLAADLTVFLGDESFYLDVINDFLAVGLTCVYWQVNDSPGIFNIAYDVITYPSVKYFEKKNNFQDFDFAEHIIHETRKFSLSQFLTSNQFVPSLALLLRDRYFPTIWDDLVSNI